jgi:ankyrin repeat protein
MLGQDGTTALTAAARGGCASVVTLLLDAKSDVNHADNVRHSDSTRCSNHDIRARISS